MTEEIAYTMYQWEGGDTLTDHPNDKGGITKYGISQVHNPDIDVAKLTQTQAVAIYIERYWNPMRCAEFKSRRVAWKAFDCAVQFGVVRAASMLQEIADINVDGKVGPLTIGAINLMLPDTSVTKLAFAMERRRAYAVVKDPSQLVFLTGWIRRAQDLGESLPNEKTNPA